MAAKSKSRKAVKKKLSGRSKIKRSSGGTLKRWTRADDQAFKKLIKQNTPTRVIGLKLKRTESSVRQHAYKLGLSLKPANRSPYG